MGRCLSTSTPIQRHLRGEVVGWWVLCVQAYASQEQGLQKTLILWKLGAEESACTTGICCMKQKAHPGGPGPWESWVHSRSWTLGRIVVLQERPSESWSQEAKPFPSHMLLKSPLLTKLHLMPVVEGKIFKGLKSIFTEQTQRVELSSRKLTPGTQTKAAPQWSIISKDIGQQMMQSDGSWHFKSG